MAMRSPRDGYSVGAVRTTVLGLAKLLMLGISSAIAAPLNTNANANIRESPEAEGTSTWVLFVASAVLVLAGGAFAGLTIALMGQDSIYLQVVFKDPHEPQQKNAKRVFDLLEKGKHWVLVTLLLSNVIVNESLPVVLDRCLGGGVAAVVGSTVLIVIFGEVLPQSVCVRYGLQIGGYMSTPVLCMMYIMAPVAWPTAKLLDWLLGEDHGTVYKKSGLKTLVTLHKSLGKVSERLNQDEVTIISAVLDLKAKSVESVMTPMGDVFTLSEDAVLDEKTMDRILSAGYSRIPIHHPDNPSNFVGMLLVRILITYDPEDCKRVSDFALATLPETRPETSCLDILNFFQEGKSHMVLVSEFPGEDYGALGVVTLEDVIEELIGEEIIDESDVYIDIHKAIRRIAPAPKARPTKRESIDTGHPGDYAVEDSQDQGRLRVGSLSAMSDLPAHGTSPPKTATFIMRRSSAGADGRIIETTMPLRRNFEEIREHLKHLGPSNPAANPKSTKYAAVKIKHAPPAGPSPTCQPRPASMSGARLLDGAPNEEDDDEHSALLTRPDGFASKDILQTLRQSYGSVGNESNSQNKVSGTMTPKIIVESSSPRATRADIIPEGYEQEDRATQTVASPTVMEHSKGPEHKSSSDSISSLPSRQSQHSHHSRLHAHQHPAHVGPHSHHSSRSSSKRQGVRSGSITENVYEAGGIRKIVLGVESESENDRPNQEDSKGNKSPSKRHGRTNSFLGSFVGKLKGGDGASDQENGAKHGDGESHASGDESEEHGDGHDHAEAGPSTGGSSNELGSSKDNKKKNRRKKRKGKS